MKPPPGVRKHHAPLQELFDQATRSRQSDERSDGELIAGWRSVKKGKIKFDGVTWIAPTSTSNGERVYVTYSNFMRGLSVFRGTTRRTIRLAGVAKET